MRKVRAALRPFDEYGPSGDECLKRLTSWPDKNCTPDDLARCVAYDYTVKELLADLDKIEQTLDDGAWSKRDP
jgi:hypothetical protein